jgi:hypothetical protein
MKHQLIRASNPALLLRQRIHLLPLRLLPPPPWDCESTRADMALTYGQGSLHTNREGRRARERGRDREREGMGGPES